MDIKEELFNQIIFVCVCLAEFELGNHTYLIIFILYKSKMLLNIRTKL